MLVHKFRQCITVHKITLYWSQIHIFTQKVVNFVFLSFNTI